VSTLTQGSDEGQNRDHDAAAQAYAFAAILTGAGGAEKHTDPSAKAKALQSEPLYRETTGLGLCDTPIRQTR
jgi:hypothetical protein